MKINITKLQSLYQVQSGSKAQESSSLYAESGTSKVAMSRGAKWINALQEANAALPTVRPEVVTEVRGQLEDGSLEREIDWNGTLDSLLADL